MNFLERIRSLFVPSSMGESPEATPGLRTYFEAARRAKLAEEYSIAHEQLDRALELIKDSTDHPAAVEIFLQRADVYGRQGAFEDAARALDGARAKAGDQKLLQAYTVLGRGRLAFAQGQFDEAGAFYDQALQLARAVDAAGAQGRAQGLRGELALQEGNASYALHLLRAALPKLNAAGDGELSPLLVGVLGQASIETGQTSDGIRLVERALKIAEQLGDVANQRRWALFLGERALNEARYPEARIYLRSAVERFKDQKTAVHVRALNRLCYVSALMGQHEDALAYAERAMTIAENQGADVIALAEATLGTALRGVKRSAEALPHLRAAADMLRGRDAVETMRTLASALADTGEMDEAMRISEQAVAMADAHGTPFERGQSRRNLGLLHFQAGQWHEAVTLWTAALALFEESGAYAQSARLYCDLGSARKALGLQQRALRDFEKALTLLNSVDSADLETRGLVYSNAAHAFAEQGGDPDSVDSFFTEAIALAEKLGDRAAESVRRGNYGYFLVQTGRPRRSISMLEQALRLSTDLGMALAAAIQRDNLGLAHAAAGEYPTALDYHRQALEAVTPLNDLHWRTSIEINLFRTLLELGDADEAAIGLRRALDAARADGGTELIVRALLASAQADIKRGKPADAAALLEEALPLARRADLRRWAAEILAARSEQQAALGDLSSARATWAEAADQFNRLRMTQGKRSPAWLLPEKA